MDRFQYCVLEFWPCCPVFHNNTCQEETGIDHDPGGWGFEVMGPAGGPALWHELMHRSPLLGQRDGWRASEANHAGGRFRHALGLGRLMGNLQSLEATIRIFLARTDPSINSIINGDTFGPLVDKYNDQLTADEPYSIDRQVVTIRNALAHGLVFAPSNMSLPLTLFHKGQSYVMTVGWFQDQQTLVQAQIDHVLTCAKKRGIS